MSDIGLNFSALDILGFGAIIALPITTICLVLLVALRLRGSRLWLAAQPTLGF